jgi:hypothetical protein
MKPLSLRSQSGYEHVSWDFGPAVIAVHFSLVPQVATGVCEALEFGAVWMLAAAWSVVLVHVLAVSCSGIEQGEIGLI